jgi:ribonuclease VapC
MVLDTSAVLAILQDEPERRKFNEAIDAAESRSLSTASFVECSMIVESVTAQTVFVTSIS